ncbi:MAG TPA: aminotransferase class V-fold PLP-dependent enzyme [Candidatus Binatia bacterium]|nr:aminotransferase class V-fold PLP-dependent enzyme [Candidatus Binatia bacterium]
MPALDRDFVRSQFPAFAEPTLQGQAFFENAGGSYACTQAIARLAEYYRRLKVQPYYPYPASTEAGVWMDASHVRLAEYLGVAADEVHFGPSTSQNSYVLARAVRPLLKAGDEVIVTQQDHEANSGVWRRLSELGCVVREWAVERDSGLLDPARFDALLTGRTRLVALTHCSNVVGHVNPVQALVEKARAAGAITVVDGTAWAPHGFPDVGALGADAYLFSLYKTYGPHQGLMVVRRTLIERLANEGHYFNAAQPRKRLVPAGPDHAQIAAARGVAEYFDAFDARHDPGAAAQPSLRAARVRERLRAAELELLPRLLQFLGSRPDVRLLGPADAAVRAPTVSFLPLRASPRDVAARLAAHGVMAAAGHFYAVRLFEGMGLDSASGAVRLSFVHYTTAEEMDRLVEALERSLPGAVSA